MKSLRGFTLIEVMVVVTMLSVLSGALFMSFNDSRALNRDKERQADLRLMQTAIELYRQQEGRYPEGCRGANNWSGQPGTDAAYVCPSGTQFIVGLAPAYIPTLPTDPRQNGGDSGYMYITNTEGSVYKLVARRTVETDSEWLLNPDAVSDFGIATQQFKTHPFRYCDITSDARGICTQMSASNGGTDMPYCGIQDPAGSLIYSTSYAVWGGVANEPDGFIHPPAVGGNINAQTNTERILCDDPSNTRW